MKSKWIILVIIIVGIATLWYWSGVERMVEKRVFQPGADRRVEHEEDALIPSSELPAVTRVRLAIMNTDGEIFPEMNLEPGVSASLTGTDYDLRVTDFYTHWNFDGSPMNLSFNQTNPAVKVEVLTGDSVLYYQWAFRNVPFFGLGGGMNHPGGTAKELAFALLAYEGLKLPVTVHESGAPE